jgi:hypothetical protein
MLISDAVSSMLTLPVAQDMLIDTLLTSNTCYAYWPTERGRQQQFSPFLNLSTLSQFFFL